VTLPVEVARLMHTNWTLCDGWRDVHLPGGGGQLSHLRVSVPPVPLHEPCRTPRSGAGGGTYRRTSALIPPSPSTQIPSTAGA
jgi:hypothetical protein